MNRAVLAQIVWCVAYGTVLGIAVAVVVAGPIAYAMGV